MIISQTVHIAVNAIMSVFFDARVVFQYMNREIHTSIWGFPSGSVVKNLSEMQETQVQSLGWEDPLEEGMATQSTILVWRVPWTEKPGRLQSIVCKESDMTKATEHTYTYIEYILFMHSSVDGHLSGFCLGYYKQHCCDPWGLCIFWNQEFSLYISPYDCSSHGNSIFVFEGTSVLLS